MGLAHGWYPTNTQQTVEEENVGARYGVTELSTGTCPLCGGLGWHNPAWTQGHRNTAAGPRFPRQPGRQGNVQGQPEWGSKTLGDPFTSSSPPPAGVPVPGWGPAGGLCIIALILTLNTARGVAHLVKIHEFRPKWKVLRSGRFFPPLQRLWVPPPSSACQDLLLHG